jgi:hypothetical protein
MHNRVGVRRTRKCCVGDQDMATPPKKLRLTFVALPMPGQVPNAVVAHSTNSNQQAVVSERGIAFVALPYAGQVADAVIVPTL